MLKTAMGMLGEYEYDTVYNDNDVPSLTWALYVLFLVINCIIIMNLLVSRERKPRRGSWYQSGCCSPALAILGEEFLS